LKWGGERGGGFLWYVREKRERERRGNSRKYSLLSNKLTADEEEKKKKPLDFWVKTEEKGPALSVDFVDSSTNQ
jgi:hypothetical protein